MFVQDHEPLGGRHPTGQWKKGDIFRERYRIRKPAEMPEGKYKIAIGMFDERGDGRHLAVLDPGKVIDNNRILVGEIDYTRLKE